MYRILIARSKRDNYASLYQYMVEQTEQGETRPVEIETKQELDVVVEDMLNNQGYSKSDFMVVQYIDYTIDAKDYSDDTTNTGDPDDEGTQIVYSIDQINAAFQDDDISVVCLGDNISSGSNRIIVLNTGTEKTLDLAGHEVTSECSDGTATSVVIHVRGGSTLNIIDSVEGSIVDAGNQAKDNIAVCVIEDSTCNIFDGVFTCGAQLDGASSTTLYAQGGAINVYDGYFETRDWDDNDMNCVMNIKNNSGSTITCYGGTFADQNPADGDDKDTTTGATFVTDGYTVQEHEQDGRKLYVVVEEKD